MAPPFCPKTNDELPLGNELLGLGHAPAFTNYELAKLGYIYGAPGVFIFLLYFWRVRAVSKIEVFNALQTRFGSLKYTSSKTTLQNAIPN